MTTIWWTIESYLAQVETGYCSVDAAVLNPCTSSWFDLFNLTHTHTRTHTHTHTHTQYGVCVTSWDVCLFSFFPCSPFSVDTSWTFAAFAYEPQLTFKLRQKQDEISKCVCACVCVRAGTICGLVIIAQRRVDPQTPTALDTNTFTLHSNTFQRVFNSFLYLLENVYTKENFCFLQCKHSMGEVHADTMVNCLCSFIKVRPCWFFFFFFFLKKQIFHYCDRCTSCQRHLLFLKRH